MSLIPLGVLATSGAAPAGAFQLLESTVLTGAQASVEFTNLASKYAASYKHLQIRWAADGLTTFGNYRMTFNGDENFGNYYYHSLYEGGGGPTADTGGSDPTIDYQWFAGPAAGVIDILDAFHPNKFKTSKASTANTLSGAGVLQNVSHLWRSTAPINSLKFLNSRQNLPINARYSLYGIRTS